MTANKKKPKPKFVWPSELETLLFALGVVTMGMIAYRSWQVIDDQVVLQDTAVGLASTLRDTQAFARDHNCFVKVRAFPEEPGKPSCLKMEEFGQAAEPIEFPQGVSVSGGVGLDPQGVPVQPSTFSVRRGYNQLTVDVNVKGIVSVR